MPQNDSKSNMSGASNPEQQHTQAAEQFEQAAKCCREAAKLLNANDTSGANNQMKAAQEFASKGQNYANDASKKPSQQQAK